MKTAIKIVLFVVAVCFLIKMAVNWYNHGQRKPFWEGRATVQVCKVPYASSDDCSKLSVDLIDIKTVQIYLNEAEYVLVSGLKCQLSAEIYNQPRFEFCKSWDAAGDQWDFLPLSVNYNP